MPLRRQTPTPQRLLLRRPLSRRDQLRLIMTPKCQTDTVTRSPALGHRQSRPAVQLVVVVAAAAAAPAVAADVILVTARVAVGGEFADSGEEEV